MSFRDQWCILTPKKRIAVLRSASFFLPSVFSEVPGLLLSAIVVDKIGRKRSMSYVLFASCFFLLPLVIQQREALTTLLLFGARSCISASFTILHIYAPEVSFFPLFLLFFSEKIEVQILAFLSHCFLLLY